MINQSESPNSCKKGWRPRGVWAWLLTVLAALLGAIATVLAYCMAARVRFDSLGGFAAAYALLFPLHLLLIAAAAALLGYLASRAGARSAALLFGVTAVLAMILALTPTFAFLARAREYNSPLSLANYLANAGRVNGGEPQADRSVVYGVAKDGTRLELDVWRSGQPDTGPLRPAIVFVHGGGWVVGNRSGRRDWDRWLNGLGYEAFDVEYRMPPPVRWLDEIGDVKAAVGWVAAHAADYHIDPARISLMGESAGGNLALLAAYSMGDPALPATTGVAPVAIRSVVDLYGPTEMATLYHSSASLGFLHKVETQYIGGSPEEFPERYRALSPLYHVGPQTPPTVAFHGATDRVVPVEQTIELDQALGKAGVDHETYIFPGNDHGFDVNWGGFATQIARAKIEDFLRRH